MIHEPTYSTEAGSLLLAGELQLIRTYDEAVRRFSGSTYQSLLITILRDHETSAEDLRDFVDYSGKAFVDQIPPPGIVVRNGATLDIHALEKLLEGERKAIVDYANVSADERIAVSLRSCVRETLIPRIENHIAVLGIIMP